MCLAVTLMTEELNQQFHQLQQETASLLFRVDQGRLANDIAYCVNGQRCNRRSLCPRCAAIRLYQKWKGVKSAIVDGPHYVAATATLPSDPRVTHLREAAQDLSATVTGIIKRLPHVTGALVSIETVPSVVNGYVDPEHDHLHAHVLVALTGDADFPIAPGAHVRLDHLEIVTAPDALGWGSYSLKANADHFIRDWRKRLESPTSFYPRVEQLSGLRLQKITGVLRKP